MPTPAAFGFYYPDHVLPTISWEPWKGPVAQGSGGSGGSTGVKEMSGVVTVLLADRTTFHKTREYEPFEIYTLAFDDMKDEDRENFRAFQRYVAGAEFQFLDSITGEYFFAQFAPDSEDINWSCDQNASTERWSAVITLYVSQFS